MPQIYNIAMNIFLPLLIIITAGYIVQKLLRLDLTVFTNVLYYLLIPCLIFSRIYKSTLLLHEYSIIVLFSVIIIVLMGLIAYPISLIRGYSAPMRVALALSAMFYNSGNYGLPVIELLFNKNPIASSVQVMVLTTQNILTFTLGIFLLTKGKGTSKESLKRILQFPMMYTVILAFILRAFHIPIWRQLWIPIEKMAAAVIPIALITLGAQLANIRLSQRIIDVIISVLCRLIVGPLMAFVLIRIFHFSSLIAQTLLISSSMPSAVNTALLALELNNESQFASQIVLISTLMSLLTVSTAIYYAKIVFV